MPVVRQGPIADPTEVFPDLCRGVSEMRERETRMKRVRKKTENEVQHRIIFQREVLYRHQVLV